MKSLVQRIGFSAFLLICALITNLPAFAADTKAITVAPEPVTPVVNAVQPTNGNVKPVPIKVPRPIITGVKIGPCIVGDTDSYNASSDDQPTKVGVIGINCHNLLAASPNHYIKSINNLLLVNFTANTETRLYMLPSQSSWVFTSALPPNVFQPENTPFFNFDWVNIAGIVSHYNSLTLPVNKVAGAKIYRTDGINNSIFMQVSEGVDTTSPLRYGTYGLHTGVIELVVGPRTGFTPAITIQDMSNVSYTLVSYRKATCPSYAANQVYVARPQVEGQQPTVEWAGGFAFNAHRDLTTYTTPTPTLPYAGYACAPENY